MVKHVVQVGVFKWKITFCSWISRKLLGFFGGALSYMLSPLGPEGASTILPLQPLLLLFFLIQSLVGIVNRYTVGEQIQYKFSCPIFGKKTMI